MRVIEHLFAEGDLGAVLAARELDVVREIEHLGAERILNTSTDSLCDWLYDRFVVENPVIREDQISQEHVETRVDVRYEPHRIFIDRSQPCLVSGTDWIFHIPFTGDAAFFKYSPGAFLTLPNGSLQKGEVLVAITRTDHDAEAVLREFRQELEKIKTALNGVASSAEVFNCELRRKAGVLIETRRRKLLADRSMEASIGFPVHRRPSADAVLPVPVTKKTIGPLAGVPPSGPAFVPEPAIEAAIYEEILDTLRNMAVAMERSPSTFVGLQEEQIRDFFLVTLNGSFKGAATGETFNKQGKTDILIRKEDRNLFIAECKVWRGPKVFADTIDQILRYTQWRDCKLAILVFNTNKDFTTVLEKIREVTRAHPNFCREAAYGDQTSFRCQVRHPDDERREMSLTILAFEVPVPGDLAPTCEPESAPSA